MTAVRPSRATTQLVMSRSEAHCEICGVYLSGVRGVAWSLHHRLPRRMGGSRRPEVSAPSNLVAICGDGVRGCHGAVERDRLWALECGLLLHAAAHPVRVPVELRYGRVRLNDAGTWTYAVIV